MSKSKKKKSILQSKFYRIYFGVVVLVLIAMCIGRIWLNGVLVDYEAAQPVYVAEKVANLFEEGDYETLYKLDSSAQGISGGDESFYLENMHRISDGRQIAWTPVFSPSEDEQRYSVTLDGERFATFSLVPSGEKNGHGNRLWKLGSVTTLVQVEATPTPAPEPDATPTPAPPSGVTVTVRAPNDCVVTVDGTQLTNENASVQAKPLMADGFLPSDVTSLTYTEFTYTAPAGSTPEVAVTDAAGAAQQVTQINEGLWSCPVPGDQNYQQQYSNAVLSLAKRIARVTARDASVDGMVGMCASNSPARKMFENYSNRWATPHSSVDYRNVVISEFYIHSDTCFTCHVSFDFVLMTSKGEQTYPTAYTFCIVQQGGKGKLYNLLMQ